VEKVITLKGGWGWKNPAIFHVVQTKKGKKKGVGGKRAQGNKLL